MNSIGVRCLLGLIFNKTIFSLLSSVSQLCPTLCDPMDCSMPAFPVLYYPLDFAQTHVHWVSDTLYPSHPLLPPSPHALNLSQHPGLFQWISCSHQVAKVEASASVFPMTTQGWFPLGSTGLMSLMSKGLSRVFFSTTVWKHQFFSTQPSLWSISHVRT